MSDIRPGSRIEFFYYADYEKENIHVMRSVIYDVVGNKMIVGQPSPGVLRSGLKKHIVVTYLARRDGKQTRFGFSARITDLTNDYQIASGETVYAIVLEQESEPKPFDIRFHFRLRVSSSIDLTLNIREEKATLIDISVGGVMISGAAVKSLMPRDRVKLKVLFDNQSHDLDAEVLRVWSPADGGSRQDLQFAAMRFINAPRLFESALAKAILKIERQMIANERP